MTIEKLNYKDIFIQTDKLIDMLQLLTGKQNYMKIYDLQNYIFSCRHVPVPRPSTDSFIYHIHNM